MKKKKIAKCALALSSLCLMNNVYANTDDINFANPTLNDLHQSDQDLYPNSSYDFSTPISIIDEDNLPDGVVKNYYMDEETGAIVPIYQQVELKTVEYGGTSSSVSAFGEEIKYDETALLNPVDNANPDKTINSIEGNFINVNAYSVPNYELPATTYRPIQNAGTVNYISGDFIGNTVQGFEGYVGTNIAGGAINNLYKGTIGNIKGNFISNISSGETNRTEKNGALGGAISNATYATIGDIIGDFINNEAVGSHAYGGAINNGLISSTGELSNIYNSHSSIGNIIGDFINNKASGITGGGGAISNQGNITSITGNFINNISGEEGGAIYNHTDATIGNITGDFIENHVIGGNGLAFGGAIMHSGSNYGITKIGNISGNFIGNYAHSSGYTARGGAIYVNNSSAILGETDAEGNLLGGLINSSFYNNYAVAETDVATGGAIYTCADLNIIANNGSSNFRGNYINSKGVVSQNAVYVATKDITLTLQAKNAGEIIFDDTIDGVSTGYNLKITGDINSKVTLNNDVLNANAALEATNLYMGETTFAHSNTTLTTNSGTVHLANGKTENYQINKLISDPNAKYTIDVDNSIKLAPVPDTITVGSDSSGRVTISDIEMQNPSNEFNVQVLYAENDSIQLDLSDDLIDKFNTTTVEKLYTSDEMRSDVWWDEQFHTYEQDKNITSTIALDTTSTTNDSIKFTQESTLGAIVDTGSYGDTLALINQYDNVVEDRNFNFDTENDVYEVTQNLGTTSTGTLNINGVANGDQRSTIDGNSLALFVLNNETNLNINNTKITGAQSVVTGYNKDAVLTLNNVEINDNTNGIETAGSIYVKGNSIFENNGDGIKVTSSSSVITLDATDSVITLNDKISGVNGAKLNLKGGTINIAKKISVLDMTMDNTNVNLQNDNVFNGADLLVKNQSTLNMVNNSTNTMYLNSLTLNDNLNMNVDVDLANRSMDRIIASNYNLNNYFVNVTRMNLLSDSDSLTTKILFADNNLKDNVTTSVSEVAYSPIWKYAVAYDKTTGQFVFTRGGDNPTPPTPSVDTLNPAVMVSPVAAQLGGYSGMLDTYAHAFNNMDMRMMNPSKIRMAQKMDNRYAISEANDIRYSGNNEKGIWVRPFASYDSVSLKNGPKINNFSYGSFIGGDTNLHEFKNGYLGVLSTHISYLGSHQSFNGNSIWQNGGNLGVTGTLYKGNFFTGLSVNAGASVADASTMYGNEDFPMLMAGVASKTGYNFEFKEDQYIIQPSVLLSYTFVNTFDYTNSAGVRIKSDPLHAIQISPNLRFIMNTKNGWQPYATVGMNWNIMDSTHYKANNTQLPNMSVKPYVQYGVGIQKTFGERLTAFLQVLIRNGGRNGFVATAGLKYYLDNSKKAKKNKVKERV